MCKKFKRDSLVKDEEIKILLGGKINGIGSDPYKLYNIYFSLSDKFAKAELEKLKLFYKCTNEINKEIDLIAKIRLISLNKNICKSKDETWEDILIVSVVVAIIAFILYKI